MYTERWVALGMIALSAILWMIVGAVDEQTYWADGIGSCLHATLLGLGLVWWGDELGEGMIGAKFGMISSPSPGWAVKGMGFLFLLATVAAPAAGLVAAIFE